MSHHAFHHLYCWLPRWMVLALAFGVVSASAQQSGTLDISPAGSISWAFTYNSAASPTTVTVVISASYFNPWYFETGLTKNGAVVTSTPPFPAAVGASGAGTYTFPATAGDVLVFTANGRNGSSGAGTAGQSATWIVGAPDKQVTVSLRNDRDRPVTYKLIQNGEVVGQITLQPGQSLIQSFNVPGSTDVTVVEEIQNLTRDGPSWVEVPGAVTTREVATRTPHPPSSPPPSPPPVPQAPDVPFKTESSPRAPGRGPVWGPSAPQTPGEQTDLLTNTVYREGVDKLIDVEEVRNDRDAQSLRDAQKAVADADAAGKAAQKSAKDVFPSGGSAPTVGGGSAPAFTIQLPSAFGGATFDLNPFRSDRLGPVVSWFRTACGWLAVVLLGVWVWKELANYARAIPSMQPAKSNAVSAIPGTGILGAATVAAAITAAIVPLLVALLAWNFGSFSISAITSQSFANPLAQMPASALWMLDQVFPVALLVGCLLSRLSFGMYAAPLFAGTSALVRWFIS